MRPTTEPSEKPGDLLQTPPKRFMAAARCDIISLYYDSSYGKSGAANLGYFNGYFNYSGAINGDDYFIIDSNFGASQMGVSLTAQAVPEPLAAGLALVVLLSRRRRRLAAHI